MPTPKHRGQEWVGWKGYLGEGEKPDQAFIDYKKEMIGEKEGPGMSGHANSNSKKGLVKSNSEPTRLGFKNATPAVGLVKSKSNPPGLGLKMPHRRSAQE